MKPKYYYTDSCCMGWMPKKKRWVPFATDEEYLEAFEEETE